MQVIPGIDEPIELLGHVDDRRIRQWYARFFKSYQPVGQDRYRARKGAFSPSHSPHTPFFCILAVVHLEQRWQEVIS